MNKPNTLVVNREPLSFREEDYRVNPAGCVATVFHILNRHLGKGNNFDMFYYEQPIELVDADRNVIKEYILTIELSER